MKDKIQSRVQLFHLKSNILIVRYVVFIDFDILPRIYHLNKHEISHKSFILCC